jgi:ribonuclease HIII
MNQKLLTHVAELLEKTSQQSLILLEEKEIPYGMQLVFEKGEQNIPLNIYYSEKKGITHIIGGTKTNPLRPLLEKITQAQIISLDASAPKHHDWKEWIGSDESGKGDFFGPLVICSFFCRDDMVPNLQKWGVRDSKLLNDAAIYKIAKLILQTYNSHAKVIILKPDKYNALYADFRKQGKKLNEMMTWMHSAAISELLAKYPSEGVLIDQFQKNNALSRQIKKEHHVQVLEKTHAESDIAVAAASIIARYHFLEAMNAQNRKYGIEFPKGASHGVIEAGREFVARFGKNRMVEVAKVHFVTYEKI